MKNKVALYSIVFMITLAIVFFIAFGIDIKNKNKKFLIDSTISMEKDYSKDWSYPWYMIKHKDGHFENTASDLVKASDTIRLKHNSQCYSYLPYLDHGGDKPLGRLKFCKATLRNDTLTMRIYDESASNNEKLTIRVFDGKYELDYVEYFFSSNVAIKELKFKKQSLTLNQPEYKKYDTLVGEIDVEFEEYLTNPPYPEAGFTYYYKKIQGKFETLID